MLSRGLREGVVSGPATTLLRAAAAAAATAAIELLPPPAALAKPEAATAETLVPAGQAHLLPKRLSWRALAVVVEVEEGLLLLRGAEREGAAAEEEGSVLAGVVLLLLGSPRLWRSRFETSTFGKARVRKDWRDVRACMHRERKGGAASKTSTRFELQTVSHDHVKSLT